MGALEGGAPFCIPPVFSQQKGKPSHNYTLEHSNHIREIYLLNDKTGQANNFTGKYLMEIEIEIPTTIYDYINRAGMGSRGLGRKDRYKGGSLNGDGTAEYRRGRGLGELSLGSGGAHVSQRNAKGRPIGKK